MLLLAITLHCQCVLQPPSLREGPNTYLCDKLGFSHSPPTSKPPKGHRNGFRLHSCEPRLPPKATPATLPLLPPPS